MFSEIIYIIHLRKVQAIKKMLNFPLTVYILEMVHVISWRALEVTSDSLSPSRKWCILLLVILLVWQPHSLSRSLTNLVKVYCYTLIESILILQGSKYTASGETSKYLELLMSRVNNAQRLCTMSLSCISFKVYMQSRNWYIHTIE